MNPAVFVGLRFPYTRLQIGGVENRLKQRGEVLDIHKVHPHKFRRTMATVAIDKGMPIEQVQKLLGHATLKMTEDLYVHLFQTDEADDMEKLSEAMEKIEQADDSEEAEQRFRALIAEREEKAAKVIKFA